MAIKIEVWGDYALFSRPEFKVERCSYDVMTPSAARGVIESIFYHPGLRYIIDAIHVLKPIEFTSVRRNEVKSKVSPMNALSFANGKNDEFFLVTSNDIQQRASLVLRDVRYVIEAHFEMTERATPSDNPGKFQSILKRRLEKGQCYSQPYLGCREFSANFRMWQDDDIPAIEESRDLGFMLLDFDFRDQTDIKPIFFRAKLENGVINPPDPVVWLADNGGELII